MTSRRWLPVAVALVILAASLLPGGADGAVGGAVGPIGVDKYLHAAGYAVLAGTALAALRVRSARTALGVVLAVAAFGGAIELLQGPIPSRHLSVLDLIADAVGAVVGAAGWWLFAVERRTVDGADD